MDNSNIILYHGSTIGNLKVLKPHISTHGIQCVYATPYIGIAVAYMAKFNDFDIATGTGNGKVPYIVERYNNALKKLYKNTGYLYTVDPASFKNSLDLSSNTNFKLRSFELISESPVEILSITEINNPYKYITNLSKSELKIYMYPNRPNFIPKDDSDLLDKANMLYNTFKDPKIYEELYRKHPKLKPNI